MAGMRFYFMLSLCLILGKFSPSVALIDVTSNITVINELITDTKYTTVVDLDKSLFKIKRISTGEKKGRISCYEVVTMSNSTFNFCYPPVRVAAFPKCATSSLYDFLAHHKPFILADNPNKEYCPSGNYLDYFKSLSHVYDRFHNSKEAVTFVNGCLRASSAQIIHRILKPVVAYLFAVRDSAEREWATYNFWCTLTTDAQCFYGHWVYPSLYRSPGMFHEQLMAANFPAAIHSGLVNSCVKQNTIYQDGFQQVLGHHASPHLVVAVEGFQGPNKAAYVKRIESYLNHYLHLSLKLEPGLYGHINANDQPGATKVYIPVQRIEPNTYRISRFQPMLPESGEYIKRCWAECDKISQLADYAYNCSKILPYLTTGTNASTSYLTPLLA